MNREKSKNILIAMDSFKGAVTSQEAGEAVQRGMEKFEDIYSHVISVADGGEGSLDAIYQMTGGTWLTLPCEDAFHQKMQCDCLIINREGSKTAYIESAKVIGLHDIKPNTQTVIDTSSYGLGSLIAEIYKLGIKEIVVFLGGTITTDGGLGLLQALEVDIYDEDGNTIDKGCNPLLKYATLNRQQLLNAIDKFKDVSIVIAADVVNKYYGLEGAAHIFAKQKGASEEQIQKLDANLTKFAKSINFMDIQNKPGSGAAGGIGGALSLLGGSSSSGFDLMNIILEIDKYVSKSDLIITGEGAMDAQSTQGKLPYKMALLAQKYNIPIIALCGKKENDIECENTLFNGIFSIQNGPVSIDQALENTVSNLETMSNNVIRLVKI